MNNGHQDHSNSRLPFPHGFNIGTAFQNVVRTLNQAFVAGHDSADGQTRAESSRGRTDELPPLEAIDRPVLVRPDSNPHTDAVSASTSAVPGRSISRASTSTETIMPPHIPPHSQREDDEDSMPELRSVSDSSDESDLDVANTSANPPPPDSQPVDDDNESDWTDEEEPPRIEPIAGSRRTRVEDDVDDARDRRHPSERIGDRPEAAGAAPQHPNPPQPGGPAGGFFAPLFGFNPFVGGANGNAPAREDNQNERNPNEHTHTHGEGAADPPPANNNPSPGHAPRAVPLLGFTFTIPLFGPAAAAGNPMGAAAGQPGQPPPGFLGMDAATREELLASFAAFFQELQVLDEGREDPERAKKLIAGLEVVPLGLVKRLERVGGAPGGHVGDSSVEGSSSGCAICWDTLLDSESDGFGTQHASGDETSQLSPSHSEMPSDNDAMDVDSHPALSSHPEPAGETSASTPASSEEPKIISLPCAHVFHASCLVPWFTRAKQATCPTCRFNIDPESLTYTPPTRRAPARPPPPQTENAPNAPPAQPPAPADGVPAPEANVTDAGVPPNPQPATADARPEPVAMPQGVFPLPPGRAGPALGIAIPLLSFPPIQIPLRPNGGGGGEQGGVDIVTIGLDMFIGGPPPGVPGEGGDIPRAEDNNRDAGANGEADRGGANVPPPANAPPQPDIQSVLEGLLRATRGLINPQGQGPVPAPAPPAGGPQAAAAPGPEAAGAQPAQPGAPPADGPRAFLLPPLRPNMFRATRPMPVRRERKTWTLPPAPGPSLRQRVEQREREEGLRCSDTSCGIGPSDEDPCPELSPSMTKQVSIHAHLHPDHEGDNSASVCAHLFHPACLVSAERVAGWGGEDKTEAFVEVSCPVCRAVGCVTRDEWEGGASAL